MNKHVKMGLLCLSVVAVTTSTMPQRSQATPLQADDWSTGLLAQAYKDLADAAAKMKEAQQKVQQAIDAMSSPVATGFVDYDFLNEYRGSADVISYKAGGSANTNCTASGMTADSSMDADARLKAVKLAQAAAQSSCRTKFGKECRSSAQLRFVRFDFAKCRVVATAAPGTDTKAQ